MDDKPSLPSAPPDEPRPSSGPLTVKSTWAACRRLMRIPSLSKVQALVGTLAGMVSIAGAALSWAQFDRPGRTGDVVAIVQAAGTRQAVADATIEILTTQNALVATLTPDATGRAVQELTEGVYVVRVSHPRYAAEARRVQVLPRRTVEVRASLRAGSSTTVDRTVNGAVNAVRRALRF
jgi:hypothetical protein